MCAKVEIILLPLAPLILKNSMMITRRNFLKAGAAVAALSVVPNALPLSWLRKEKAIGVQLYSVRGRLEDGFDGTMKALVDIGYKRMEAAGYRDGKFYGKSPAEMKKYLADLGARMVGSHTGSGCWRRVIPRDGTSGKRMPPIRQR